ncbi:hypothetical protein QYE76_039475 [Lolium multiflorum]|uniref:Reverse transcriptase/retrotransposon-derived protein RNase H-like domain-containing protein n=1 Tax=Lolium multiflorum TaxID=4521 RepID=A0AAD8TB29_LOLMU|nr:hypothetical protein QYE76_039475 [Lolium multiflorum]
MGEWTRGASPVSCKWVKPQGPPRGFDFDVTKAEQIFDLLLKEKQLKVPEGHKIPTGQELNGKPYCKWHNTFTHATNDCRVWRQQIQMAIEQGRLIFSQYAMKVDTHPFPAVNMVECTYPGRCQPEQQQAFDEIKRYLTTPPVLVPPQQDRPFYIYLSVADMSIASVVVQLYEGVEKVIFYLSRRMLDAETRYPEVEKLCLCLFFTCTKLHHILLTAEIIVVCKSDVVKHMLSAPVLKGRLALMSDTIEDATELRLWSLEKIKENKARVARAYNKKVRPKEFQVGDLVWEAVLPLGTKDKAYGKWSPNWHGPYKVIQVLKGNAYMLDQLDGVKFPVAVNGQHLKKYFPSMWDDGPFLGIEPHWGLWRKIFYVKRHNDSNGPPVVGGVGFVVRKEIDYFDYPMKESVQGWRNKWFYLRDPVVSGRRSNLPPFDDVLVAHKKKSWNNALSPEEKATADELFKQIVTLKNSGGMTMCGSRCRPMLSSLTRERCGIRDDDDDSEGTEDAQHALEDSDVQEEETAEDDSFFKSRRRKQVHDDLIASAESSSTGGDNDADEAASPPPAKKGSTSFFVDEDDLDLSADDDDDVPLAKRAKLASERVASAKESNPSPAKSTPPSRTGVEKVPISRVIPSDDAPTPPAGRDHPIYATVDAVADFAEQFTRLEAENAQLRKAVKSSADKAIEASRIAADVKSENALLKEEVTRLKRQMKDDQDARRAAAAAIDKKEGVLRESVKDLLEAANLTVSRRHQLREDSTADALSLAAESNVQILRLLQKSKGALSKLYSMIFPKAKLDKTLDEMAEAFLVDPSEPVEVLKRRSRLIGAVLTFQLLMGHGMGSELEEFSKALPVDDENHLVDLEPFKRSAITCANRLLKLVAEAQAEPAPESAPGSTSANP